MKWLRAKVLAWLYQGDEKTVQGLLTANYNALSRLNKAIERYENLEASRVYGLPMYPRQGGKHEVD